MQKKTTLNICNRSIDKLLIWIEPYAYYEDLKPNSIFKIDIEYDETNIIEDFFDLDYQEKQVIIVLNIDMKKDYTFIISIDNEITNQFQWSF